MRFDEQGNEDKENFRLAEEEYLPIFKRDVRNGDIILDKIPKKSFRYYSELFMKSKVHLKPNTIRIYKAQIDFWNSHFGDRDISEIKVSEIKRLLFERVLCSEVLKELLNRCKNVFEEAYMDETITENPCNRIKVPKGQKPDIFPFSKDEVQRLLSKSSGFFRNYLAVAFYTGVRTGELLAMKWQNVDFEKKRIYIDSTVGDYKEQGTKTFGSNRYVPMFDVLIPYLKEQQKLTGMREKVFCTSSGRHYGSGNLTKLYWKPLLKRLKIPYRSKYQTRHTFCTNMLESQQFNLNQIAKWMGHSTIQTLIRRYNKFIPSENINFDADFDVFKDENVPRNVPIDNKGA